MSSPTPSQQVEFLARLQRLLTEGGFTASYKFALLLALADIAVEKGDGSGATLWIAIEDIAERFVRYYWRQAVPYVRHASGHVLQQSTDRQAEVIRHVQAVREHIPSLGALMRDARAHRTLVTKVARVVRTMPLFKLQTLGRQQVEFLYRNQLVNHGIELLPGVGSCLRRFHPLVQDLVRGAWLRFVRRLRANQAILGETADLAEFMFGSERTDLANYVPILQEMQSGACFYCLERLAGRRGVVDHFVPWSRYPVDLGHNFVLAHATCNASKADMLAAVPHLERWVRRNGDHGPVLAAAFDQRMLLHDLHASVQVTRWAYHSAEGAQAQVWLEQSRYASLASEWRRVLG